MTFSTMKVIFCVSVFDCSVSQMSTVSPLLTLSFPWASQFSKLSVSHFSTVSPSLSVPWASPLFVRLSAGDSDSGVVCPMGQRHHPWPSPICCCLSQLSTVSQSSVPWVIPLSKLSVSHWSTVSSSSGPKGPSPICRLSQFSIVTQSLTVPCPKLMPSILVLVCVYVIIFFWQYV